MTLNDIVILGAGQAGLQVAASLRQAGFEGSIRLVGDEAGLPYQRPPLSKAYLSGEMALERLWLKPEAWFAKADVSLRKNTRIKAIDRSASAVLTGDGSRIAYDHLILATGGQARRLPSAWQSPRQAGQ